MFRLLLGSVREMAARIVQDRFAETQAMVDRACERMRQNALTGQ